MALARAHGHALVEGEALRARAELCLAEGDRSAARADARAALAIFERLNAAPERDALRGWLAELERRTGVGSDQ